MGIPAAAAAIILGGWVLAVLLAALATGGVLELYRLAKRGGVRAFSWVGAGLAVILVLLPQADGAAAVGNQWFILFAGTLALGVAALWWRETSDTPLGAVAVTVFGAVLVGGGLSYAVRLRNLPAGGESWQGIALVAFPLLLTWISDSCGYFFGRAWGRHRLMPTVSPGKSIEGAVAGIVGTVVAGAVYGWLVLERGAQLPIGGLAGGIGGAVVSVVAQLGDLAESLIKREAGVKDSGGFFPGHGGVLDRLDSLFFTFPVGFWYLSGLLGRVAGGVPWR